MFSWDKIKELDGKTLHTVVQKKPFEIILVTDEECLVRVRSTGKVRPIPRSDFERASALGSISSLNTAILREKGASEVNPAYVLAILRAVDS